MGQNSKKIGEELEGKEQGLNLKKHIIYILSNDKRNEKRRV